mmetsp:Transcript_35077/g.81122  ORF Transcript_35077/g.81122 Transcript_35077/m.81122 type:complete len:235 (-) Transcript_35077:704-1408(-)
MRDKRRRKGDFSSREFLEGGCIGAHMLSPDILAWTVASSLIIVGAFFTLISLSCDIIFLSILFALKFPSFAVAFSCTIVFFLYGDSHAPDLVLPSDGNDGSDRDKSKFRSIFSVFFSILYKKAASEDKRLSATLLSSSRSCSLSALLIAPLQLAVSAYVIPRRLSFHRPPPSPHTPVEDPPTLFRRIVILSVDMFPVLLSLAPKLFGRGFVVVVAASSPILEIFPPAVTNAKAG